MPNYRQRKIKKGKTLLREEKHWYKDMQIFTLPQLSIDLAGNNLASPNEETLLLIAGGREPAHQWLKTVASKRKICCADKGADYCRALSTPPTIWVGDGDSCAIETAHWLKESCPHQYPLPRAKDFTDSQFLLDIIAQNFAPTSNILITGVWGGRFDHLYSLIFTLAKFSQTHPYLCCADDKECLYFLPPKCKLTLNFHKPPLALSLLPISTICRGVTTSGTFWNLTASELKRDFPYAISNILAEKNQPCTVEHQSGLLAVYCSWQS